MKTKIFLTVFLTSIILFIYACTPSIKEANNALINLNTSLAALEKESAEIEQHIQDIQDNPTLLIATIDPNLYTELQTLKTNIEELKDKIEPIKDDNDKLLSLLLTLGIGIFGGGTGVNLYKNKHKTQ